MKIAKKALVVVMAIVIAASMSAMAFAAGEKIALTSDGSKNVTVNAVSAIGLKSFDFTITADDGITLKNVKKSSDAAAGDAADNGISTEFNKASGQFSGYFKNELWAKDQWETAADDLGEELPAGFDPANFNLGTIVYEAAEGAKGPAYIYVKGAMKVGDSEVAVDEKVLIVAAAEEPSGEDPSEAEQPSEDEDASKKAEEEASKKAAEEASKKAAEEASKKAAEEASKKAAEEASKKAAEEASKKAAEDASKKAAEDASKNAAEEKTTKAEEKTTKAEEKTTKAPSTTKAPQKDGGVNTGDNMALAAAAGVVALAGAAFVLTKKRK
jgi:LPXTG-motif cell wall-anchored protein